MSSDIDGDGKVNMLDLLVVRCASGKGTGYP